MPVLEGAGVHLKRAFGHQNVPELDPFLLLDDFHSNDSQKYIKGFPWQGPIVMNTDKELETAFEEYRNNTFIKHSAP